LHNYCHTNGNHKAGVAGKSVLSTNFHTSTKCTVVPVLATMIYPNLFCEWWSSVTPY